jgi:hypothetical protein
VRAFAQRHDRPQRPGSGDPVRRGVAPRFPHDFSPIAVPLTTEAPNPVRGTLRSGGQPLDPAIRAYMEPRFGHDFSKVRVHTGTEAQASAAAERALAYTAGTDLVFGAGQYRPSTVAGRWLIAHELAHVIQQRGPASTQEGGSHTLERQAGEAGMRVALGGAARVSTAHGAPPMQFARVSDGGFGRALEDYTSSPSHLLKDEAAKAVKFLKSSATFRQLVKTLDTHYVWFDDPAFSTGTKPGKASKLILGPDGVAVEPASAKGMRAIRISTGGGSRFTPAGAPPEFSAMDFISIESPDVPTFIAHIAHEATHAAAFVGASAPAAKTLEDEIKAAIQDEVGARQSEKQVLSEIKDPDVNARANQVGDTDVAMVERDFSPASNVTYLEGFFFSRELHDAQVAENIDEVQAEKIRSEIDAYPGSPILKPDTKYGQIWYAWRTAEFQWQEFKKQHSPGDSNFDAEKEKEIQNHAKWFFKGKTSYHPLPANKP